MLGVLPTIVIYSFPAVIVSIISLKLSSPASVSTSSTIGFDKFNDRSPYLVSTGSMSTDSALSLSKGISRHPAAFTIQITAKHIQRDIDIIHNLEIIHAHTDEISA